MDKREFEKSDLIFEAPFATLGVKLESNIITEIQFSPAIHQQRINNSQAKSIVEDFNQYFSDATHVFQSPTYLKGTLFRRKVWQQLTLIPCGQTRTYGELASAIHSSPRAIGGACRHNPIPVIVPCHRVVARNGNGGYAGSTSGFLMEIKRWLLKHEGVIDV